MHAGNPTQHRDKGLEIGTHRNRQTEDRRRNAKGMKAKPSKQKIVKQNTEQSKAEAAMSHKATI